MSDEIERAREWLIEWHKKHRTPYPYINQDNKREIDSEAERIAAYHAHRTAGRPQGSAAAVSPIGQSSTTDCSSAHACATTPQSSGISAAEHPTGRRIWPYYEHGNNMSYHNAGKCEQSTEEAACCEEGHHD